MTGQRDSNIVTSGLSGIVTEQGITVEVHSIRLEDKPGWTLEVVNQNGTSIVWDDPFVTDDAAWAAFRRTVRGRGHARLPRPSRRHLVPAVSAIASKA